MTTTLDDIFNPDLLNAMVTEGYIRIQNHPDFDLHIANYTERAQFDRVWNDVTLNTRGLIFDGTGVIIARGFPKFFNWDDSSRPYPPPGPMTLSTKFDGSLGILYLEPNGDIAVATRGSFASDQAKHATEWLRHANDGSPKVNYGQIRDLLHAGFTPLVEIIYPGNRIVVDYHGADTLVLLDVVDNETGHSNLTLFDDLYWFNKAEKRLIAGGFNDSLTHEIPQGEEGFVLYWPGSGFRCKMKSAEYVELHRLVTGLSKKSVWEMIGQGKTTDEIKMDVPDELFQFVDETAADLYTRAGAILDQVEDDFMKVRYFDLPGEFFSEGSMNRVSEAERRSAFARLASKYPATKAYLFKMYDGAEREDLFKMVWKSLKPVGDTRAWGRGEDVA